MLVELVVGEHGILDAEMLEQHTARARVLGQNQVGFLQDAQGTVGDVFQIAHGRRHNIKYTHTIVCIWEQI